MPETIEPIPPGEGESPLDSELDGAGDAGGTGLSLGLREAIIFSLLSCATALTVAWLHL